jgi:putative methionine-R-sulfoxide reductase with GAF domain
MLRLKLRSRLHQKGVSGPEFFELLEGAEDTKNLPTRERFHQIISTLSKNKKDIGEFTKDFFSLISEELQICQGALFLKEEREETDWLCFKGGFAHHKPHEKSCEYQFGEGLVGQVAKDGITVNFNSVPEGYMTVLSGLGEASPSALMIFPVKEEDQVLAVIELASFHPFTETDVALVNQLGSSLAPLCKLYLNTNNCSEKDERCDS